MPQLIDFYEEFEARREEFEIFAFHRANKSSFEDLDPDLASCKERYWKGRDLPFPILLDSSGATIRALGVTGYPTMLLVDPEGKLQKWGSEDSLRRELMKTDPAVAAHLKTLRAAKGSAFGRAVPLTCATEGDAAVWALMFFAEDDATESQQVLLHPHFASLKSENAQFLLLGKQGLSSEKVRVRLSALKAIETIEEPHQMMGYNLSRALEREENKRVKKAIQKVLEDLAKKAPK